MVNSFPNPRPEVPRGSIGSQAEMLAADYLMHHGLTIVARNFRTRFGEIDLIARDGSTLVFVEVRMRSSGGFGGGLESITAAKRARIVKAANGYLATLEREPTCRFDAVVMQRLARDSIVWRRDILGVDA